MKRLPLCLCVIALASAWGCARNNGGTRKPVKQPYLIVFKSGQGRCNSAIHAKNPLHVHTGDTVEFELVSTCTEATDVTLAPDPQRGSPFKEPGPNVLHVKADADGDTQELTIADTADGSYSCDLVFPDGSKADPKFEVDPGKSRQD